MTVKVIVKCPLPLLKVDVDVGREGTRLTADWEYASMNQLPLYSFGGESLD